VPKGLVDRGYTSQLSERIHFQRVTEVDGHGDPPRSRTDVFEKHTTHIAAVDADGNWVAITATINTSFGSKVIVPGTGVLLNNQMDDFSIQPGVPNAFGLVGAEANAVAPGKRPLSSMSPTIVLRDGRPVLTIGAAGGPTIISQVVLGIVRHIDLRLPLDAALAAPRFHHQWSPNELVVEEELAPNIVEALRERGHVVKSRSRIGVSQAIGLSEDGRTFVGVHDPRVPGQAAGP
jgi:gamma-glutamyltranspeptidase/glutathione hydrolase